MPSACATMTQVVPLCATAAITSNVATVLRFILIHSSDAMLSHCNCIATWHHRCFAGRDADLPRNETPPTGGGLFDRRVVLGCKARKMGRCQNFRYATISKKRSSIVTITAGLTAETG